MQINQFPAFTVSHRLGGCRSLQSLSCFPKASSSFTISCVNCPEKIMHMCQNNILLIKQEDVFSLLTSRTWCDFPWAVSHGLTRGPGWGWYSCGVVTCTHRRKRKLGHPLQSETWQMAQPSAVSSAEHPWKQREDYFCVGHMQEMNKFIVPEGTGGNSLFVSALALRRLDTQRWLIGITG